MPSVRRLSRAELYVVFKTEQAVKLVEELINAINDAIPADITLVQANVDAHIADAVDAHQASAIGNTPAGGIAATTVQAAINELDTEKVPATRTVNGHPLSADVTVTAGDVGAPSGSGSSSGTNTGDQTISLTGDVTGSGTGSFAATVGKIGGKAVSLAGALTTAGAFASTFTMTGVTTVTFPTSGTLATLAGAEAFTNKTISGGSIDNTPIGATTQSTGKFTTVQATSYVKSASTVVASLPAAATAGAGARLFVTDATATTFLSTVAGGGANKVPVVSDGTNWLIG